MEWLLDAGTVTDGSCVLAQVLGLLDTLCLRVKARFSTLYDDYTSSCFLGRKA
jgi:hypothetical protein